MSPPLKQLKIPKTSIGFTKGNVVGGNLMKEMVKKSSNLSTQEWKNFNCFFVSIIRVYAAIIASTSFLEMQLIYVFFSLSGGKLYVIDFKNMIQYRVDGSGRVRCIKRDSASSSSKGIAGLTNKN